MSNEHANIATLLESIPEAEIDVIKLRTALDGYRANLKAIEAGEKRIDIINAQPSPTSRPNYSHAGATADSLIKAAFTKERQHLGNYKDDLELVVSQLASSLSSSMQELHGMRVNLAVAENVFDAYDNRRKQLRAMLKELKNQLSPVKRIPDEIWHQIFRLCCEGSTHGKTALDLSHVCAGWRAIALDSPHLYIVFGRDGRYRLPYRDWVALWSSEAMGSQRRTTNAIPSRPKRTQVNSGLVVASVIGLVTFGMQIILTK